MASPSELDLSARVVPVRLIQSAVEAARAEATLVLLHVRVVAVRAVGALLATILAGALLQVFVVLALLSPLLSTVLSAAALTIALTLSALIGLGACLAAFGAWRALRQAARDTQPDVA